MCELFNFHWVFLRQLWQWFLVVQTLQKEAVHVFLMAPFTIWNPLNHVERKSITSYDETQIVDQRVHVLWQFNVDKPTKTYKNRLQHGRTWIILATENHFGSSSMFINDSSRLYSARCHCCQPKPLWKPTQQQQAAIWRERNGILSQKMANRKGDAGNTQRNARIYHSLSFAEGTLPLPHRFWLRKALSILYFHSSGISMDIWYLPWNVLSLSKSTRATQGWSNHLMMLNPTILKEILNKSS